MPVNMDPKKRRAGQEPSGQTPPDEAVPTEASQDKAATFGEETEEDREKDAADAEWTNLWDATEVIDMDKW